MIEKIYLSQISTDVKNCLKDCLLSLFFRKVDLIAFIKQSGSTSAVMKGINDNLTKSQIVDLYFNNLAESTNKGNLQVHSLIRSLIEWKDFDSYWFRNGNLDPDYAKGRIEKLKELLGQKTELEEQRSRIKEREAEQEKLKKKNQTITDLRNQFYEMCKKVDESQQRGYDLEKFLGFLFPIYNIDVYKPFKLIGEQVDGSFKHDGENYIFESKWQDKEVACNQLYSFAFKIESNSLYPRGVFFSINGYTEEALQRISYNKKAQLILFDAIDFIAVLEERIMLPTLLDEKIRYAQTRSKIYINANEILK